MLLLASGVWTHSKQSTDSRPAHAAAFAVVRADVEAAAFDAEKVRLQMNGNRLRLGLVGVNQSPSFQRVNSRGEGSELGIGVLNTPRPC